MKGRDLFLDFLLGPSSKAESNDHEWGEKSDRNLNPGVRRSPFGRRTALFGKRRQFGFFRTDGFGLVWCYGVEIWTQ